MNKKYINKVTFCPKNFQEFRTRNTEGPSTKIAETVRQKIFNKFVIIPRMEYVFDTRNILKEKGTSTEFFGTLRLRFQWRIVIFAAIYINIFDTRKFLYHRNNPYENHRDCETQNFLQEDVISPSNA